MAVLGKIRKRVGLLIGFVGVSMVLFILGDLVTSNKGIMGRNSDVIGEIGGEKIHYQEFERRVTTLTESYKDNYKKETVEPSAQEMLREQAWSMYVNDLVLVKEYEKLGLSCSSAELYDMCTGRNPNPQVRQAFTDPKTNIWDPNAVVRFLKDLPNREEAVQRQWRTFEDAIKEERVSEKYKNLIKNGLFITSEEAKRGISETTSFASIRFVRLDYNTIPDSSVKIEDSDLSSYYNENKNRYKQPETVRRAEYITFDVAPSQEDRDKVMNWINTRKEELAQSTNDIQYVNQNSDVPFDSTFHPKGFFKADYDSILFHSPVGTILGPAEDGNMVKVWKLTAEKMIADSVKARHILIHIENGDTARAMAVADSLRNAIKKGSKFEMLAMMFSKDGSATKGGDLGWFPPRKMVGPFNDACFDGKKGDMPIVKTEFGVHLIEILDKAGSSKQIQVGVIARTLEPSQKTFDLVYNKANEFAAKNTTAESFESSIVKEGLNKRIADNVRENDKNIAGLDQPRELVRWIYSAKKGDLSKVFTMGDKYVIAHLTDIREKGFLPLDEIKDAIAAEVRKVKKGDMLVEKFNAAGTSSIDAIAQKLNTTATDADNVRLANPYIAGIGSEPKIVGAIFGHKAGQLTKPLKGDNGVAVIFIKGIEQPPLPGDFSFKINDLTNQLRSRSENDVFNALKEKALINDNRGKFY